MNKLNFWRNLDKPIIGLAPMDGVTDEPMRYTQAHIAKPDVCYTEFVNVEHIEYNPKNVLKCLIYSEIERPIVAQLSGYTPELFYKWAKICLHLGFDGIDINMGCPSSKITPQGAGAKLIDTPDLAKEIALATHRAIDDYNPKEEVTQELSREVRSELIKIIKLNKKYGGVLPGQARKAKPALSVKTRTGTNEPITESWISFLADLPIDSLALHGRTLDQGYVGKADWGEIAKGAKIAKQKGVVFLGNGDIKSLDQAQKAAENYKTDGVLMARGAQGYPWVFSEKEPTKKEILKTILFHARRHYQLFGNENFINLRKHFGWYPRNFEGARELKVKLQQTSSLEELKKVIKKAID